MPKVKATGVKPVNTRKTCPICGKSKYIKNGFYKTSSPMFEDGCVPICITCVKQGVLNEDGTINKKKLKTMCQRLDRPLYWDDLDSAYKQARTEHGYLSDDEVAKMGEKIVGYYFKNINSLRQTKNKSFADSETDGHIHANSNISIADKDRIIKKFIDENQVDSDNTTLIKDTIDEEIPTVLRKKDDFEVTEDIVNLFGEGYTKSEYKKMYKKYEKLKLNYTLQTNLHQEALATYVRFKVKEEDATAKGNVDEAKKWYDAAQNAAANGKLTPKALSAADLQKGMNSVSELIKAVEQATDVIKIMPQFKYRPNDSPDFTIMCYVNYERELNGQPQVPYEEIYSFYDKKKKEYLEQNGDPYGIFDHDPSEKNRDTVKTFLKMPDDYEELAGGEDEDN